MRDYIKQRLEILQKYPNELVEQRVDELNRLTNAMKIGGDTTMKVTVEIILMEDGTISTGLDVLSREYAVDHDALVVLIAQGTRDMIERFEKDGFEDYEKLP